MSESSVRSDPPTVRPRLIDLFLGFAGIAIVGFGGVMPWAYRMLVEQRRWLTPSEFSEALAVAQFLPGGNIINLGVAIGQREHGIAGALVCVVGLLLGPFVIVTSLAGVYLTYGQRPEVHGMLAGIAAAAAGLMLSMAAKMARPLLHRAALAPLLFAVLAFLGIGIAGLSLIPVLAVLIPLSVAYAWWRLP